MHKAGWDVESAEFGKQAEAMLLQLYEKPTRNIADAHRVALELLTDNACVGKDSLVVQKMWNPGMRHLHYEHVFAGDKVGHWMPMAGYEFNDQNDVSKGVHWQKGLRHPKIPHAYTAEDEGFWLADDGYIFNCFQMLPGMLHLVLQ